MKGEGYFSVAHDEKHPFIVVSSDIYTKVYGTEFNVRSYGEEDVHVTIGTGPGCREENGERFGVYVKSRERMPASPKAYRRSRR